MLIECATGRYPYPDEGEESKELGFWEIMEYITIKPSPKLPKDEFSADFCDFVDICLRKQGGTRSSATQLLNHPWIQKYANEE